MKYTEYLFLVVYAYYKRTIGIRYPSDINTWHPVPLRNQHLISAKHPGT